MPNYTYTCPRCGHSKSGTKDKYITCPNCLKGKIKYIDGDWRFPYCTNCSYDPKNDPYPEDIRKNSNVNNSISLEELLTEDYCPKCNAKMTYKESGCYIATAVYGSYDAPQVKILRNFRDIYLLNRSWGKKFVILYYKYSLEFAEKVRGRKLINNGVKIILDGFVKILKGKYNIK